MALARKLEDAVQKAVIGYIESVVPHAVVWACPNAARRTAYGRPTNAVPGLRAGAPDLIVALPGGRTLHIECKSQKGRVSIEQIGFHGMLAAINHDVVVVRSVDDVRRAFLALGIKTREAA